MDISELLAFSVKNNASDLHLSAGEPPMIRVDGEIRRINVPPMDHKTVHALIYDIMNDRQRKDYEEFLECDFSFEIPDLARFRVNAFNHQRGAGAVFRTIPSTILTFEQLGCPAIFADITDQPRGLCLVTGPTGSGKSTTLAAMIDYKNDTDHGHILTIEQDLYIACIIVDNIQSRALRQHAPRFLIFKVDPLSYGFKGKCPVHGSGVYIGVT